MRIKLCGQVVSNDWARIYRYFGYEICCPKDIRNAIDGCEDGEELVVEINSGGGSVYAGFEMYSLLRTYKGRTVAEVQGLAASAMSVVICACDEVLVSPVANVMLHRASTVAEGNSRDMRQAKRMLDTIDESIRNAYVEKSGGKADRAEFARMMSAVTFLTAEQAVACGLADGIMEAEQDGADPALAVASIAPLAGAMALPPIEDLARVMREIEAQERETDSPEESNGGPQPPLAVAEGGEEEQKQKRSEPSMDEIKTKEQLAEAFPELTAQIAAAAAAKAFAEGTEAERKRIAGIDALVMPGFEEIIQNAKADPEKDAGAVAQEIIRAQKEAGGLFLAAAKADAETSGVNSVPAASSETGATGKAGKETVEAAAKAAVDEWMKENRCTHTAAGGEYAGYEHGRVPAATGGGYAGKEKT